MVSPGRGGHIVPWEFTTSTFLLLLLLSGVTVGADYLIKKAGIQTRGRLITAAIICGAFLFCFAPAVQTLPNGQSKGTVCGNSGCSDVLQFKSVTAQLWCYGASYQYAPLPELGCSFDIETGCYRNGLPRAPVWPTTRGLLNGGCQVSSRFKLRSS